MVRLARRNTDLSSPWSSLSDWTRDFDQIFEELDRMVSPLRQGGSEFFTDSACDIHETESDYFLSLDMPGVQQSDIDIETTNGFLTVVGERKKESTFDQATAHRVGRVYGKFQRSFRLPQGVDVDKIQASVDNGVLYLAIPKAEAAKPKKIEIGSSKNGFLRNLIGSGESSKAKEASK